MAPGGTQQERNGSAPGPTPGYAETIPSARPAVKVPSRDTRPSGWNIANGPSRTPATNPQRDCRLPSRR